ncbi:MAG TPA: hypothetical protein VFF00_10130 [Candidatus Elarobacter sp.]|nr:hypothetical protein [Candidatus Elarobacter sp.]
MRFGSLAALTVVALAVPAAVLAQTAAPPAPAGPSAPQALPRRTADSAFALGGAYREIGRAEQVGATGHYIDAARTHYRSAIARHDRSDDAGASAEARLASDLARVAIDERPANAPTGPRDVPAPPTPRPGNGRTMVIDGMPMPDGFRGMPGDGPTAFDRGGMLRMMDGVSFRFGHGGFDAAHLAELLKVETGAEARQLAQNAVDANAAAQKAALAGNVAEASRQTRIANDLATAVHDLAALNHPELRRTTFQMRVGGFEAMPH